MSSILEQIRESKGRPISIKADRLSFLAAGYETNVFSVDGDDKVLVKVRKLSAYKGLKAWFYRRVPAARQRYIHCEKAHSDLINRRAEQQNIPSPLARVYGTCHVQGNLAQIVERIRDGSGSLAPNISAYAQILNEREQLLGLLNQFADSLLKLKAVVHDLNPGNVLVAKAGTNKPHLVVIDGYGDRKLIKARTRFSWFRTPHVFSGLSYLGTCLGLTWDSTTRCFTSKKQ